MKIIACQIRTVSDHISGLVIRSISEMSRLRSRFSARIDMLL